MATLMELWNDWELQVLVLLSFMLQASLFFAGGLRRRSTNAALRFMIWLAYLLADFIAVYALGQLSRQKNGTGVGESHQLVFFWTPFLLIHLGGQDTTTAFSVEDNELWLRHLLNLLAQVGLALYVFWKSATDNQFLVSAVFAFVAGIIKYGERTWALKSASQKALRSSSSGKEVRQFPELEADVQEPGYLTMVKFALSSSPGVINLFVGRKLEQMEGRVKDTFCGFYNKAPYNGELVFKILQIELGMMYDNLYTKARMIRTRAGAILRFITLISLLVAFVLFLIANKQCNISRVDVAITYTLFVGALCLEVCAIFVMVMMSTWTWDLFRSWRCHRLGNAAWYIFKTVQPESRPLWSNSMGQYNFLNSCFSDNVIGKMMNLLGASDLWRNFRHTKSVDVNKEISKLVFEDQWFVEVFGTSWPQSGINANRTSGVGAALDFILRKPFEEVILSLHIYTDIFLHRYMNPTSATSCLNTRDTRHLMHLCRTLSKYMCYLLVLHPDMLPVSGSVRDVLEKASDAVAKVTGTPANKDKFLEVLATDRDLINIYNPVFAPWYIYRRLVEEAVHSDESLHVLVRAWVGVLMYAAGKSRGEVHAKHLSLGGELFTFLWLHLAHRGYGDQGLLEIEIIRPSGVDAGGRKMFIWGSDEASGGDNRAPAPPTAMISMEPGLSPPHQHEKEEEGKEGLEEEEEEASLP